MGERAVIERGMGTLEEIGQGESTTFGLPQELTSLVDRYGKHLTGSDTKETGHVLESLDFDAESREMEAQAQAQAQTVTEGSAGAEIKDPDELIEEMDSEIDDGTQSSGDENPENV